ncbi:MAG TPA: phage terminase large subunit [Syntrophorhabdaceae bacterium]
MTIKTGIEARVAATRVAMQAEATPFEDASPQAKEERIRRSRVEDGYFAKTYLPHYFSMPSPEFHKEIYDFTKVEDEPVFIAAPREHAKSTIVSFATPVEDICLERKHFIIIISDTEDLAADFNVFIQLELEENERIRADFGNLKGTHWASSDFTTRNGIRVKARGRGQRIRGIRNREYRPDRVIIDDLENDKNVRNPKIIKETVSWLRTTVMGSLAENFSMLMIGTVLAKNSVLTWFVNARDDAGKPLYVSKIYRAIQGDPLTVTPRPLWPEKWSLERLEKKRRQIGSINFNQEFMNDPRDEEGMFREEWLRHYYPEEITGRRLRVYTYIDPSMENGASSDYKAIITLGMDDDGTIYILDAFIRKCSVDTMARVGYSRYEEFAPVGFGMEQNALGEFALSPFALVAKEKKHTLPIRGVRHSTSKEARVGRLSAFIERGIIRFQKGHSDQDLLVEQLLYFPSSTVNDDGPDALEGAVAMAETGAGGEVEFQSTGHRREMSKMGNY